MSTPSERLEAEIWLDTTDPDLPACQREGFFHAVDEYYDQHPTAERGTDFLAMLHDDNCAFAGILDVILSEGCGRAPAVAGGAARPTMPPSTQP